MTEIATWRVNLLRAAYVLIVVGLGSAVGPQIFDTTKVWEAGRSVVVAMLAAFSLLALLGLRYPLRMLPLLLWETAWKTIWLLKFALPLWLADRLDARTAETAMECLLQVVIIAVIPWDHVYRTYFADPTERWRGRPVP